MRSGVLAFAAAAAIVCAAPAFAADQGPIGCPDGAPAFAPAALSEAQPRVAAGTLIDLEILETIGSRTHKRCDRFSLRLTSPITLDGRVIVPAGATGQGQVIDAQASRALGTPAQLLIAARFIEVDGLRLPLKGLRLGVVGRDPTTGMMVMMMVPYVGLLAGFMHGGEIEIPAGTRAQAKLTYDLPAPLAPADPPISTGLQSPGDPK